MKHSVFARCFALVALCLLVAGVTPLAAQQSLTIENGLNVAGLESVTVGVSMTNTAPVEGFVLAICIDEMLLAVTDVSITDTVTEANNAELVVPETFINGFTLGVVMDAGAPFDGQTIPVGTAEIAHFDVMPVMVVAVDTFTDLTFCDGVLNSPPLFNLIVEGGQSIQRDNGLGLIDAMIEVRVPPPDSLTIEDVSVPAPPTNGGVGCSRILMNNQSGPVQGFVLAISNTSALDLVDINIDGTITDAVGAEFVVPSIVDPDQGGTLGVVLDFQAPFGGQTIPVGGANHIANFCYTCDEHPVEPDPEVCHPLTFVDGVLGNPPLTNVIVVAGLSLNPTLNGGQACCQSAIPGDTFFYCGQFDENGNVVDINAQAGTTTQVCFFWSDPTDNGSGFQLSVEFDCLLGLKEGTFSIEGSILDDVGAEFVNHHVDNNPNDGDGCELIVGILLDALPPFEGQTVPSTATPLLIGCIDANIDPEACDATLTIQFVNGLNGRGSIPIENVFVVGTVSEQSIQFINCSVNVTAPPIFIRCDCNHDEKCDIADAATVLRHQFDGFPIFCEDACDANDDGKINLADTVYILNYLFNFGPEPSAPFPDLGLDPTEDNLDCLDGDTPCP